MVDFTEHRFIEIMSREYRKNVDFRFNLFYIFNTFQFNILFDPKYILIYLLNLVSDRIECYQVSRVGRDLLYMT